MWDPPGPGIKPVSLVLQGKFLTTGPPGKPPAEKKKKKFTFKIQIDYNISSLGATCLALDTDVGLLHKIWYIVLLSFL